MKKKYIQTACFGVPEYEMMTQFSYRPRISNEHMLKLWALKNRRKKPITQLVAEALEHYFDTMEKGGEKNELSKTHDSR
jgi:predicted DNA-binding protein